MTDAVNVVAVAGAPRQPAMPPHLFMVRLLGGFRLSRMLDTLVEFDVAERLAHEPKTPEQLAREIGCHARSLKRVLRAVAAFGIFAEDATGRFSLTADAELLRAGAKGSVHPSLKVFGQPWHWNMWGGLMQTLVTGKPAFVEQAGEEFEDWTRKSPDVCQSVAESKAALYEPSDAAILETYDFSAARHVVDFQGGAGALLGRILAAYPACEGTVIEHSSTLGAARRVLDGFGVGERARLRPAEDLGELPSADLLLLRGVLHYYGDDYARSLLQRIRASLRPDARLLVCEMLMPAGNAPFVGKFIDVESMLLTHDGRERSESEYTTLLQQAGFRVERVLSTKAPISIIEASPAA
jgi:hypothetical protein